MSLAEIGRGKIFHISFILISFRTVVGPIWLVTSLIHLSVVERRGGIVVNSVMHISASESIAYVDVIPCDHFLCKVQMTCWGNLLCLHQVFLAFACAFFIVKQKISWDEIITHPSNAISDGVYLSNNCTKSYICQCFLIGLVWLEQRWILGRTCHHCTGLPIWPLEFVIVSSVVPKWTLVVQSWNCANPWWLEFIKFMTLSVDSSEVLYFLRTNLFSFEQSNVFESLSVVCIHMVGRLVM